MGRGTSCPTLPQSQRSAPRGTPAAMPASTAALERAASAGARRGGARHRAGAGRGSRQQTSVNWKQSGDRRPRAAAGQSESDEFPAHLARQAARTTPRPRPGNCPAKATLSGVAVGCLGNRPVSRSTVPIPTPSGRPFDWRLQPGARRLSNRTMRTNRWVHDGHFLLLIEEGRPGDRTRVEV